MGRERRVAVGLDPDVVRPLIVQAFAVLPEIGESDQDI